MKAIHPHWNAPACVKACSTLLNTWGQQDPKSREERHNLTKLLDLPTDPIWLNQTHGTTVLNANPTNTDKDADASYANKPNHVCVVLTADCLPILLCNTQGTQIAAIHAGWRGLAAGIIENTLAALAEPGENVLAWLGPAIGPKHFEVGKDVYDAFTRYQTEADQAFTPHKEGKWLANLYTLATQRLENKGVTQISGGEFCTYSQSDLFPSYRRDKGTASRIASVIWIAS